MGEDFKDIKSFNIKENNNLENQENNKDIKEIQDDFNAENINQNNVENKKVLKGGEDRQQSIQEFELVSDLDHNQKQEISQKQKFKKKQKKGKNKKAQNERGLDKVSSSFFKAGVAIALVSVLPFWILLLMLAALLLIFAAMILSLLTLTLNQTFMGFIDKVLNLSGFALQLLNYTPYVLLGASSLMLFSLILTCFSKNKKAGRIVVRSLFLVLFLLVATGIEILKTYITFG